MAFMNGKGAVLRIFITGDSMGSLEIKSWSCKPNVTKINDGVNGEDRDRLDVELNYFDLSLTCFNSNASKLAKILGYQAIADSGGQAPDVAFGLSLKDKSGGKNLYKGQEAVIDDWEWASSGRTERQMLTIPIRCTRFDLINA